MSFSELTDIAVARLKRMVDEGKISQAEIARATGKSGPYISDLLKGKGLEKRKPRADTTIGLATVARMPMSEQVSIIFGKHEISEAVQMIEKFPGVFKGVRNIVSRGGQDFEDLKDFIMSKM